MIAVSMPDEGDGISGRGTGPGTEREGPAAGVSRSRGLALEAFAPRRKVGSWRDRSGVTRRIAVAGTARHRREELYAEPEMAAVRDSTHAEAWSSPDAAKRRSMVLVVVALNSIVEPQHRRAADASFEGRPIPAVGIGPALVEIGDRGTAVDNPPDAQLPYITAPSVRTRPSPGIHGRTWRSARVPRSARPERLSRSRRRDSLRAIGAW